MSATKQILKGWRGKSGAPAGGGGGGGGGGALATGQLRLRLLQLMGDQCKAAL